MPAIYPGSSSRKSVSAGHRRSAWLIAAICALAAPGCEEEARNVGKRPETRGPGSDGRRR